MQGFSKKNVLRERSDWHKKIIISAVCFWVISVQSTLKITNVIYSNISKFIKIYQNFIALYIQSV